MITVSLSRSFQGSSAQGGLGQPTIYIAHGGFLLFLTFPVNWVTTSSPKHKYLYTSLSYCHLCEQGWG